MEAVREILTCKHCLEIFKSTPIVLSCCSETICKHHIDEFKENKDEFLCKLCNNKSSQKSFPINKIAEKFLKMNIQNLEFGEKYNLPKKSCKNLENLIKEFEILNKDPKNYIYEYVSKIKLDVDLKREELKEKIDQISNEMINKLEVYEKQCCENLASERLRKKVNEFSCEVLKIKSKLNEWENELDLLIIDDKKWENIRSKSIIEYNQLESLLNEFKNDLTLNQECKFNKSIHILNDLEKDLSIQERTTYTISKNIVIPTCFGDNSFDIQSIWHSYANFRWKLIAKSSRDPVENQNYLNCKLSCEPNVDSSELAKWPIYVSADFIIVNLKNSKKNFVKKIKCLFEEGGEWGIDKIININEILDLENGFYDLDKNEISLQIKFNIEESIENKITLQINNFSEWFNQREFGNAIDSSRHRFGNFEWFLEALATKCSDEDGHYLGFYLFCQSINKKNVPIYVSANMKLLHLSNDPQLNYVFKFNDIFQSNKANENTGYGFSRFVKIKNILDEKKGFYNSKTDKITLQATFNYFELVKSDYN